MSARRWPPPAGQMNLGSRSDHEMLLSVLQCGFYNPGKAFRPIIPTPGNQPDPIAIAHTRKWSASHLIRPEGMVY
jgi:hypothetical protein